MSLEHVGDGLFVDKEPFAPDEIMSVAPKEWSPALGKYRIYPWVYFESRERAAYGLRATEGAHDEDSVAEVQLGVQRFSEDAIAPLSDFEEALKTLSEGKRYLVEEYPYSEITKEADYRRAVAVCLELKDAPEEWSPEEKDQIEGEMQTWKGPGVYDMRDCPPLQSGSAEEHELDDMEYWAEDTLEFMFQGDEWKPALRRLLRMLPTE